MELRDYWRVFKRRAWIPAALALAAMLTAGVLGYLSKPTYTATSIVFAKVGSDNLAPIVTLPQAAVSNTVVTGVIQRLGLQEPVDRLVKQIQVGYAGVNLYRVTVTDSNADRAVATANEVARQAVALYLQLGPSTQSNTAVDQGLAKARDDSQQRYLTATMALLKFQQQHPNAAVSKDVNIAAQALQLQFEQDAEAGAYRGLLDQIIRHRLDQVAAATGFDARVVDRAVAKPDTSGQILGIFSTGALALLVGVGLVMLLQYMDNSVREPELAEEIVGAPVIGVIPRASPHSLRAVKGGT